MRIISVVLVLIVVSTCEDTDESKEREELFTKLSYGDRDNERVEGNRRGRLLSLKFLPIFSLLRQNPAVNYAPYDNGDPFDFLRDSYPLPPGFNQPMQEYDFVIIGAGSSGSVIASRLSEENNWSVLLLEAGTTESILTDIPLFAATYQSTDYNWGYRTEKRDDLCLGMDDQKCAWSKGKAVGGSSVINYMLYTRGRKLDWDRIAQAGNPGWSYDDVLPYFLKSEGANLNGYENSEYHNTNGLLGVSYAPYSTPVSRLFLKAGEELGNNIVDYNRPDEIGFARVQTTTKNGRRSSAASAFLHPFKNRNNLHILPKSRVTKININNKTKRAKSVEYIRNRQRFKVKARKEIILSAGTLASPQLLMLSGVGPESHLKELDIPVIQNLKVGETIYDHICFPGLVFLINTTKMSLIESNLIIKKNVFDWLYEGKGPFTVTGGVEAFGFIKTPVSDEISNFPDLELIFLGGSIVSDSSNAIRKGMKIADWFYNDVYGDIVEKESWSVFPMLLTPKSKGYLKLKDKNPFHWPRFYYDYFMDKRDMLTLIEGIKYTIKLSETKAFQSVGSRLHKKHFPTCRNHEFGSDDYWECAIRSIGTTLYHQIATCKMGPASDPEAVVDHELKVHGIKNLRVGDVSVIPKPITAHTNAPAIMIGEKLADMIKNTWK